MTQVSKYPVSKDVYERIFDILLKTISSLKIRGISEKFLQEFLSPTEQVMLAKRLAIAFLLSKNYDWREISRILRVSTGTVARVSVSLKNGRYYKKVINKLLEDEKLEEFWLGVGEIVTKLLSAGGSKSGSWRYLRAEIEKTRNKKVF